MHSMMEFVETAVRFLVKLWNHPSSAKRIAFRTCTGITSYLFARYCYLKIRSRMLGLPPGPIGWIPFINSIPLYISHGALGFLRDFLPSTYGPITTHSAGLGEMIMIHDPVIAHALYQGGIPSITPSRVDTTLHNTEYPDPIGWRPGNLNRNVFGHNYTVINNIKSLVNDKKLKYSRLNAAIEECLNRMIGEQLRGGGIGNAGTTGKGEGGVDCIDIGDLIKPLHFNILLHSIFGISIESSSDPLWTEFYKLQKDTFLEIVNKSAPFTLFNKKPEECNGMIDYNDDKQIFACLYPLCKYIEESIVNNINYKDIINNNNNDKTQEDSFYNRLLDENFRNRSLDNPINNNYTKNELFFDIVSVLNAALDTFDSVFQALILCTCKYQDIQEIIHDEVFNVVAGNNATVDNEKVIFDANVFNKVLREGELLINFQSFVYEVLRLYLPAFGTFQRVAKQDIKVTIPDGYKNSGKVYNIPKGFIFSINSIGIHYNSNYFGDKKKDKKKEKEKEKENGNYGMGIGSDKLYLENWQRNGKFVSRPVIYKGKSNIEGMYAFGAGIRKCPGSYFAEKEMFLIFAHILLNYKMVFDENDAIFENGKKTVDDIKLESVFNGDSSVAHVEPNVKVKFVSRH